MNIPLILFAKAPQPGKAKTRLQTHCSESQAADIAEILLNESVKVAKQHWPGSLLLATWPTLDDPKLNELAEAYKLEVILQSEGDLGAKMESVFSELGYPAAIMGSDAPLISKQALKQAYQLLNAGNNVIGPSEDGGYYLIGLSQPCNEAFADMPWGTEKVLELTLERQAKQTPFHLLETNYDIDTWPDLLKARAQLPLLNKYLQQQGLV